MISPTLEGKKMLAECATLELDPQRPRTAFAAVPLVAEDAAATSGCFVEEGAGDELLPYARWVVDAARHVIISFGPRSGGSQGELAAQEYFAAVLRDTILLPAQPSEEAPEPRVPALCATRPQVFCESFAVHPHAFMAFIPVMAALSILSMGAFWIAKFVPGSGVLCWVLAHAALLTMVLEMGLYREFLDPLFPRRTSHNVFAVVPARRRPAKRRLIIGGHADAAFEWRYNACHPLILWVMNLWGIGCCIFAVVCANFVPYRFGWAVGALQLFFCVGGVLHSLNCDFRTVVPGANDNLSGALCTLALAQILRDSAESFDDIDLVFLVTGSEEAGLRGAKAYAMRGVIAKIGILSAMSV
eukprot:TRINITY_DN8805_c0_g1_i2.p1 TRINITY_DN8805_c0_g1~~TRINITY_DN8805_c0_g1_i2.p1  ORF type:complete len:358 (+),score=81.37 TRINITY_DN8805_c0_g1_i2:92-1165(+)